MRTIPPLILALAIAACGRGAEGKSLPDVTLPTLGGPQSPSLATCPTEKCFTVVVAPWCGYCRRGTPVMIVLREWLARRGVAMRVIVGLAGIQDVKAYAQEFGPESMLDPEGKVKVTGGVPHFYVTDQKGSILKEIAGMPMTNDPERFAAYFGLP